MSLSFRTPGAMLLPTLVLAVLCACADKGKDEHAPAATTVSQRAVSDALKSSDSPAVPTSEGLPSNGSSPGNDAYSRMLDSPSDLDMVFVLYDHMKQTPPFSDWAESEQKVRYADEFKRADLKAAQEKKLRDQFNAVRGTGKLTVTLDAQLSEYASDYQEFYISAFEPGRSLGFKAYDAEVVLEFANARDAYRWKVTPEEAKRIFEKNGSHRGVTLTIDLRIDSARPRNSGGVMRATVLRYTIDSGFFGKGRLSEVRVVPD